MQVRRLFHGVKGAARLAKYASLWEHAMTDEAKRRINILSFWEKYELKATLAAFSTKRRTLFLWKSTLKRAHGDVEALNPRSKRPRTLRRRKWPPLLLAEIKRLRQDHPNLGKEKIFHLLQPWCVQKGLPCPKPATIGNLIKDMGGLRLCPVRLNRNGKTVARKKAKKSRKPKQFVATHPGHCVALDTVERFIEGNRRYIITFTDLASRFSLAWATRSHASQAAKDFFNLATFLFPFPLQNVLTDNGSEFMKHFDEQLRARHLTHWHTYPKTPKMNAHAERFNRTLQEEYIDYHEDELLDPEQFNVGLMQHLLWHNTERPHWSLKMKPPVQFIQDNFSHPECNMYVADTTD